MSIAVLDARGWQNTLDLETGEKIGSAGPVVEMVKDVLQRHPYPGDLDQGSNGWVTDTAFDLIDGYGPRLVFLTYGAQYFSGRYMPMTQEGRARMILDAFLQVERFVKTSGFAAIVVGTGAMTPLVDFIDVTRLDGLAVCTHWSTRYAGLYGPSQEDLRELGEHPHIEKILRREQIVSLFHGTPEQMPRVPEYLMLACEGYAFKTVSDVKRAPVMIPSLNFNVPLYAPGHTVEAITGIRQALEEDLSKMQVALIVMEGIGPDEFVWPHLPCRNGTEWYYYEPGEAQYLTIVSGRHRFLDYPRVGGKNT